MTVPVPVPVPVPVAVPGAVALRRHRNGPDGPDGRADQLKQLRLRMAAISGKVGAVPTVPAVAAVAPGEHPLPPLRAALPVPPSLAEVLPAGLPGGTVAVLAGARSLMLGMVAAVTASGGNAAIVGLPDIGLLAAVEMGADLGRLAVIADPGKDPVEVAAVLLDGMDLVVLGLGGRSVSPARARVVTSRARQHGCALLVADGGWPSAALRLEARVRGYEMACAATGSGRIGAVRLGVRGWGRQIARTRAG